MQTSQIPVADVHTDVPSCSSRGDVHDRSTTQSTFRNAARGRGDDRARRRAGARVRGLAAGGGAGQHRDRCRREQRPALRTGTGQAEPDRRAPRVQLHRCRVSGLAEPRSQRPRGDAGVAPAAGNDLRHGAGRRLLAGRPARRTAQARCRGGRRSAVAPGSELPADRHAVRPQRRHLRAVSRYRHPQCGVRDGSGTAEPVRHHLHRQRVRPVGRLSRLLQSGGDPERRAGAQVRPCRQLV